MKILFFNWKDLSHPQAGGAEILTEALLRQLAEEGHEVRLITAGYEGSKTSSRRHGYEIIRIGGRFSVYWQAYRYYKKHLKGWADLVVEEVNTIPFFTKFYVKEPTILFIHQLCRRIWFYQMGLPLNFMGYLLEPLYLRLLRGPKVITVSESSRRDLSRHGFSPADVALISEGIELSPLKKLQGIEKFADPTLLSLGALRSMKRTLHQITAFEYAKTAIPNLKLKIAGGSSDAYGQKVQRAIQASKYRADIEYLGHVTRAQKMDLMQKAHLILVSSVKEGWGLIVTEAASQGTPAVVYNVDGLRDSVRHQQTGLVTAPAPESMAEGIVTMLQDQTRYHKMRTAAWQWSQQIRFENSYRDFKKAIGI